MELDRKAFHFDLDNKSVERFYTGKKNPWSDIQDFLESHCFEKPQYSGAELGRLSESSWNATDSSIPSIPGMSR